MGARILSDKLLTRVPILRVIVTILLVCVLPRPAIADQGTGEAREADQPMPFEKGTVEISVLGGISLPTSLFRAKSEHQLTLASFAIGRVMAGGPGRGS